MSSFLSGKQTVRLWHLVTLWLFACGGVLVTHAGIRGPGKYCGVVVFDRWDTCFLLSGPYITYISDSVKDDLRPYKGKAMQIDASDVFQPMNPGDALVRQYKIIGPAPDNHLWAKLDGLELIAGSDFGPRGSPAFLLEIPRLPERFLLNPGQSMKARITFAIPRGEYQFMFGYGGGVHEEKSLASNTISFALSDEGTATLVE